MHKPRLFPKDRNRKNLAPELNFPKYSKTDKMRVKERKSKKVIIVL